MAIDPRPASAHQRAEEEFAAGDLWEMVDDVLYSLGPGAGELLDALHKEVDSWDQYQGVLARYFTVAWKRVHRHVIKKRVDQINQDKRRW